MQSYTLGTGNESVLVTEFTILLSVHIRNVPFVGWSVVLGLTALYDSISVYIGPSPKERENEERKDR